MTEDIKITTPSEYFTKNTGNQYEFYLSGEIESADNYISWFDVIRNAREQDTVKIYINSPGGDLYTALQFLRVMGECEAHLITSVEGCCMSAATMIFLSGHEYQVTPHSLFMFHNYSGGVFGKGGEQYDQIQYERAWSEKFMNEVYKDFLTTDEIKSMLDNKDIWMTSEQVLERIEKVMKKLHEEQQAMEAASQIAG
jgi:ATP-dependent protease ClpP protease subunit